VAFVIGVSVAKEIGRGTLITGRPTSVIVRSFGDEVEATTDVLATGTTVIVPTAAETFEATVASATTGTGDKLTGLIVARPVLCMAARGITTRSGRPTTIRGRLTGIGNAVRVKAAGRRVRRAVKFCTAIIFKL